MSGGETERNLSEREAVLEEQRRQREHRAKVRRFALDDLVAGKNPLEVAATWGVTVAELERWVDDQAATD